MSWTSASRISASSVQESVALSLVRARERLRSEGIEGCAAELQSCAELSWWGTALVQSVHSAAHNMQQSACSSTSQTSKRRRENEEKSAKKDEDFLSSGGGDDAVDNNVSLPFVPCARLATKSLDGVIGMTETKQTLLESMYYPRKYPNFFPVGFAPFRRILLYGPPGTGKSSIVRAMAGHVFGDDESAVFAELTSSDFLSSYFSESEMRVRQIFAEACMHDGPVILYLDEIDSLARSKSGSECDTTRRIKNELLRGLDAVQDASNVWVIASTNVPWDLEVAVLRRFERRMHVPLPDAEDRRAMMMFYLGTRDCASSSTTIAIDLDEAVARTAGYSGSDLRSVCRYAELAAVRELIDRAPSMPEHEKLSARPRAVTQNDILLSLDKISKSVDSGTIENHEEWKRKFG